MNKMMVDYVKELRVGNKQSALADYIEQLQAEYKILDYKFESFLLGREDLRTLQIKIEQLEASTIHAKWKSAMETIEQLEARIGELEGVVVKLASDEWLTNPKKRGSNPENIHISRWFAEWEARRDYACKHINDNPPQPPEEKD